jgi:hemerythrin-like domain-containing protein
MSEVMASLHRDHIHFSRVLNHLRADLETLRSGEDPDFDLLHDALDYLSHYADLYHHPKEDVIYHYQLEHNVAEADQIDSLLDGHRILGQITESLRAATEGILGGTVMLRAEYADQLADFLDKQTAHLNLEEAEVFPYLERTLKQSDWDIIEARAPTRTDPLFGPDLASQFEALYQRLTSD